MEHPTLREKVLARVATALGLREHAVPPGKPDLAPLLMPVMMDRFGLDRPGLTATNPDLVRLLDARCRACSVKGLCMEALARGVTADGAQGFCPNASILEAVRPRKVS